MKTKHLVPINPSILLYLWIVLIIGDLVLIVTFLPFELHSWMISIHTVFLRQL